MSLLIPSIVHPNPIQPPNNRPFRWIKSVKRSLPKQPLILQFRPWPERDVRTNYLSARKREQLVEKLTERGGGMVDRSRGGGLFGVYSYLHGFRVNYKCGTWPYLGQPEPDRSLSCSNRRTTLFRMLMTHVLLSRLLVIMLSIMWIMEMCIYVYIYWKAKVGVVSFSWWWVRKNYSFLIFTFVSIFEVFVLNVGSKIVKSWMEIISEDSIRETKTFLFFILLMNIVESILLLSKAILIYYKFYILNIFELGFHLVKLSRIFLMDSTLNNKNYYLDNQFLESNSFTFQMYVSIWE